MTMVMNVNNLVAAVIVEVMIGLASRFERAEGEDGVEVIIYLYNDDDDD